ncbi:MAG: zinc-binding dehydrogenase [Chloroflexota bacterium]|nr:zinc-binding dehydrogenase [Chloroflexota bacterium]
MQAIVFHQHGDLDALEFVDNLPVPVIAADEVLVRVSFAALNRLDQFVITGWKGLTLEMPHIPGADFSGQIVATGTQVTGWVAGQAVTANPTMWCGECSFCLQGEHSLCDSWHILGEQIRGSFAQFVKVPARNLIAIPNDFSMQQAAAAPLVAVTTWRMLVTRGQLKPGQVVLIVGAGGGVNSFAIQLARLIGATVWVVASNSQKASRALELGADWVVDRSEQANWSKAVFLHSNKQGVDVVVDNVGENTWQDSLRSLKRGGRLLTVGGTTGYAGATPINLVFGRQLSILGSTMGSQSDFETVMGLLFRGKLATPIDSVFPLREARMAEERLQSGQHFGKILLRVAATNS